MKILSKFFYSKYSCIRQTGEWFSENIVCHIILKGLMLGNKAPPLTKIIEGKEASPPSSSHFTDNILFYSNVSTSIHTWSYYCLSGHSNDISKRILPLYR